MTSSASNTVVLVLTTIGAETDGAALARTLVEERLAACVNVLPVMTSFYRWKGKLEKDDERLLVIKTRADRFAALRQALIAMHSYEVPEVLALPVADGHAPYLQWLDAGVAAARGSG